MNRSSCEKRPVPRPSTRRGAAARLLGFAGAVLLTCASLYGLLALTGRATRKPAPSAPSPAAVSVRPAALLPYPQMIDGVFNRYFPHKPFAGRFSAARAENADTVGWVFVPGTTIDMAVTQSGDNAYYLKHGLDRRYKWKGNPFLDYRDKLSPLSRCLVLYGHNMGDGDLFGQLKKYESLSFLNNHPVVYFGDGTRNRYFKIFAVFITDVEFHYNRTDFSSDEDFMGLVSQMKRRSFFNTRVDVRADDRLLLFSTCTYEFKDARFVVAARLLRTDEEEILWDPPAAENPDPVGPHGR